MEKNILIIDDSALMRRVISDIINSDERFHLANIAHDGLEAYDLITRHPQKYDAILLDINMPKMNGIQLLEQLSKLQLKLKIIMVSTLTKEGTKETVRCLELGAFDFITKPESLFEARNDSFRQKIIYSLELALGLKKQLPEKKVRIAVQEKTAVKEKKPESNVKKTGMKVERKPHTKVGSNANKLVALACSTGGPKALHQVVPFLPKTLDAPVIIVQHMPGGFTESLAQRLNEVSEVTVKEALNGELLEKGIVYIAKGGCQLRVSKKKEGYYLSVTEEAARNGLKPCADILYESLAGTDFDDITCVVLTGMGGDGTLGIKELNDKNNIYVIAQNEATCTVYGMPKVVYEAGLVDEVVSLNHIADAITKNVGC